MNTKSTTRAFAVALTLLANDSYAEEPYPLHFSPENSVNVSLKVSNQEVNIFTKSETTETTKKIAVDTDKKIHVEVNDYNFDGRKDFSIWYVSDGMGTYSIYRIFTYSKKVKEFVELIPKCGDEFINVRINPKRRELVNSYYDRSIIKTCSKKY